MTTQRGHNRLAPAAIAELDRSITHFQSQIWQCNCMVILNGGEAIVIDSCWNRSDIERIAERVARHRTHHLVTHADIDHTCAIGLLPGATVVMGPRSRMRLDGGAAAAELREEARMWGFDLPADLRIDRVVEAEAEVELGSFRVATIEARGHAVDGLGYVLREEGIFAVGDYLSSAMYPLVWWSLSEALRSTYRLLEALHRFDLRWVVPGHGPLMSVDTARRIGDEDISYLEKVERAADQAQADGLSPREWHLAVHGIDPPRPATADIEMICPRMLISAATFRDRGVDGHLPWVLNMA
jgi:glyoxylase-like metal-dependent hydrolase (beta-lactamase superfamily II)